ncbi:aspartate racemase [candidate division WOR-1 bacterium DG_54_3]|uniref:Aspartate racemase n=1 Tax=candidate division WOR-1 bacterium DG_54_3 TaxID=1703775 RepID=A0A0S7Y4Q2_UNCSA|nr:MAG: aspartate racemase [candidate division WOR-1 bacterium DG_54_3]
MKTIGLIGGMSWESSSEYYRIINKTVKERLGGLHSAQCIMYSADFEEIESLQHQGKWEELTTLMINFALSLEGAGADCIVICTNTMHKMAEEVEDNINIPLLHIADATAERIVEKGLGRLGLLGTSFTMEEDFYKKRLQEKYNIEVIIPSQSDREIIDRVIYNELCLGTIKQSSKEKYKEVIERLISDGADGVILGCTEIPLLISQEDVEIPLFDTTTIHAKSAVEFALR